MSGVSLYHYDHRSSDLHFQGTLNEFVSPLLEVDLAIAIAVIDRIARHITVGISSRMQDGAPTIAFSWFMCVVDFYGLW